jgi:hypothetical protein
MPTTVRTNRRTGKKYPIRKRKSKKDDESGRNIVGEKDVRLFPPSLGAGDKEDYDSNILGGYGKKETDY